jgi:hypothetical protein
MNRYARIPIIKNSKGRRHYVTVRYPNIPLSDTDAYIICGATDRYDKLAQSYYGDSSLWWIIAIANNASTQDSLFPPLDTYIRIPQNYLDIKAQFNTLNDIIPSNISDGNNINNTNNTSNTSNTGTTY